MPTWGEILAELRASVGNGQAGPDFDGVRRKYLSALHQATGRDTIIYYTDWLHSGTETSITLEDMQAAMEVCKGLTGSELDLILHSPGGQAEAAKSLVEYLRLKYSHIRVIVPLAAMSAATMVALAADEIVMGKHSQLGPIDPQIFLGGRFVPSRAIIEQFDRAKAEIAKDPSTLNAWYPILQQYGPGLIAECEAAEKLSKKLVGDWLKAYMFSAEPDPALKALQVAEWFGTFGNHLSHGLGITRKEAEDVGVNVVRLESNLQDEYLSVHHACMHTLSGSAVKIVENHNGVLFAKMQQQAFIPMPVQLQPGP